MVLVDFFFLQDVEGERPGYRITCGLLTIHLLDVNFAGGEWMHKQQCNNVENKRMMLAKPHRLLISDWSYKVVPAIIEFGGGWDELGGRKMSEINIQAIVVVQSIIAFLSLSPSTSPHIGNNTIPVNILFNNNLIHRKIFSDSNLAVFEAIVVNGEWLFWFCSCSAVVWLTWLVDAHINTASK